MKKKKKNVICELKLLLFSPLYPGFPKQSDMVYIKFVIKLVMEH